MGVSDKDNNQASLTENTTFNWSGYNPHVKRAIQLTKDNGIVIEDFTKPPAEIVAVAQALDHIWRGDYKVGDVAYQAVASTVWSLRPGLHAKDSPGCINKLGRIESPDNPLASRVTNLVVKILAAGKEISLVDRIDALEAAVVTALAVGDPESARQILDEVVKTDPNAAKNTEARLTSRFAQLHDHNTGKPMTSVDKAGVLYGAQYNLVTELHKYFPPLQTEMKATA